MRSRLENQSVSRQMVPTGLQRRFHEDFMNKLGRQRGPLQPINFRLNQPSPATVRICPELNQFPQGLVTAHFGRPRHQGDWGICGKRDTLSVVPGCLPAVGGLRQLRGDPMQVSRVTAKRSGSSDAL